MKQLDTLVSYARIRWPEMPENVRIVYVKRGTRVILKAGCCRRTYVDLQALRVWESNHARLLGYAGYDQGTNQLFVRIVDLL